MLEFSFSFITEMEDKCDTENKIIIKNISIKKVRQYRIVFLWGEYENYDDDNHHKHHHNHTSWWLPNKLENNDNDDSCNDNNNINEGCHGDSDKNDDNLLQIFYLTNVIFVLVFWAWCTVALFKWRYWLTLFLW